MPKHSAVTEANDPLVGAVLAGRYAIERRLGMGGMGAVYLARQRPLGRAVALKVLRKDLLGDPVAVERFHNEAKVIAQLGHPHIVSIHDFGTVSPDHDEDGGLFIAMEYLAGRTLSAVLREEGPLPWTRTLGVARDVARALSAAHRRGVVHRDLKPDNIILVEAEGIGDFVKVLDFGIAKVVNERAHAEALTGTGFVPGTPGYIAPEQVLGGGDDVRSDLYALGVTWFEMLTRRRPFSGDSAMKIFLAQIEGTPPRLKDLLPHVPDEVDALVGALLDKDPDRRPKSADALLARLSALAEQGLFVPSDTATPVSVDARALSESLPPDAPTAPATTTPAAMTPSNPTGVAPFSLSRLSELPSAVVEAPPSSERRTPSTGVSPTLEEPAARERGRRRGPPHLAAAAMIALVVAAVAAGAWYERRHAHRDVPVPLKLDEPEIEEELVRAFGALYAGEVALADRTAERILARSPDEPGALLVRGVIAERQGDFLGRDRFIRAAAGAVDDSGDLLCGDGEELLRLATRLIDADAPSIKDAWRRCEECRSSLLAHLVVAELLASENVDGFTEAVAILEEATTMAPDAVLPYVDRARFLIRLNRADEAVAAARAGLERNPRSPLLRLTLARGYLALGRYRDAAHEVEGAGGLTAGRDAAILLASAHLFLGEEEARRRVLEAALTAPADVRLEIVQAHGSALVGAGRGRDALALFRESIGDALAQLAPSEAAYTLLVGLQAMEAGAREDGLLSLSALGDDVLKAPELSHEHGDLIKAVQLLVQGVLAAERGDLDEARAVLQRLESAAQLPPQARAPILSHLRYRVLMHEPGGKERALGAAATMEHRCRVAMVKARIHRAAGDVEDAKALYRQVVDMQAYCKQSQFEGAYVMESLADLAELYAEEGDASEARRAVATLRELFPYADADTPALVRARAVEARLEAASP